MVVSAQEKLKFLRSRHGLSQEKLGEKTGISRSHIANLETLETNWHEEYLALFAAYFKLPKHYFTEAKPDGEASKGFQQIWKLLFYRQLDHITSSHLSLLKKPYHQLEQELEAQLLLGIYYFKTFAFDEAIAIKTSYVDNYLDLFGKPSELRAQLWLLYFEIQYHKYVTDYEAGVQAAVALDKLLTDERDKLVLKLTFILLYFKWDKVEKVYELMMPIKSAILELGVDTVTAEYYVFFSATSIRLKLYNQALEVLEELEVLSKRAGLTDSLAKSYQHRGTLFGRERREFEKAIDYHKKGLALVPDSEKGPYYRSIITNLCHLKRFEEAAAMLATTVSLPMTHEIRMGLLVLEGQVALYQGDMVAHKRAYKESLDYFKVRNDSIVLRYIYTYLGDYYSEQNKFKKASEYYKIRDEL